MQAKLERAEIKALGRRDHDLAVEDAAVGQRSKQDRVELGEVAAERLGVTALEVDL